jgi:hypothetical protein
MAAKGAAAGDRAEGRAGEDSWCFKKGLWPGVGGISRAEKADLSKPGV